MALFEEDKPYVRGDPFWPVKKWPVKFDQLFYANQVGPRGSQNFTGHLVFTYGNPGGRLKQRSRETVQ